MEEGSETDGASYKLTLFSDIRQNFKHIKETLDDELSIALEEELLACTKESVTTDACLLEDESDDEDDIPLSERNGKFKADDRPVQFSPIQTRNTRRQTRRKKLDSPVAAPTQTSDIVDLIDSDDELMREEPLTSTFDFSLNESIDLTIDDDDDDINGLVSVKINWMDLKIHRFELRKHQRFTSVFQEISEKENVPAEKILLILRDRIFIAKDDTPESLELTIVDIIEGGITKEIYSSVSERRDPLIEDSDMLEFKCVLQDQKKPLLVTIKKTDCMYLLMERASKQLQTSLENLKFKFEGDILDKDATPVDLDLEGGEVIEIFRK